MASKYEKFWSAVHGGRVILLTWKSTIRVIQYSPSPFGRDAVDGRSSL